jgi:hypothetical protein
LRSKRNLKMGSKQQQNITGMQSLDRFFLSNSSCGVHCVTQCAQGVLITITITPKGTAGQKRVVEKSRILRPVDCDRSVSHIIIIGFACCCKLVCVYTVHHSDVYPPPLASEFRHANGCCQRSQRLRRLFVKCAHVTYSMYQATLKHVDLSQHGYKIARSRRQC